MDPPQLNFLKFSELRHFVSPEAQKNDTADGHLEMPFQNQRIKRSNKNKMNFK